MVSSLPNLLTVSRVVLVPVIIGFFYVEGDWARYVTALLFVVAATTDYVDGYLARSWKQHSPFGRWLDPVADKLLVAATVVMLVGFEQAPLLPAVVIVLREILVSGLREYLAEVSVGMPVTPLAKWKTAVQMTAIGFLLVGDAGPAGVPVTAIGSVGLWIAAALTLYTGYGYLRSGLRHMFGREPGLQGKPPGKGKLSALEKAQA